jgi:hypothetical protein
VSPTELLSNFDQPLNAHSLNTEDKRCIGERQLERIDLPSWFLTTPLIARGVPEKVIASAGSPA